jgi:cellulose biosynthesis protein BcsQ
MTSIALYNMKGGVGKTAGCVNLAYLAAEEGKSVLIWDLDPQGAASFYLESEAKLKGGIKKMLQQDVDISENIQETSFENLYLLPADFSNRHLDSLLTEMKQSKKKLKSLLTQMQGHYDYLFIDCPPGIGALSEAIFSSVDCVLMPSIPTTLSMRSWDMVRDFFKEHSLPYEKLLSYFSMVDVRKNMHNETLSEYHHKKHFLKNYIPYLSTVEKMGVNIAPVAMFAPSSYAAQCFRDVWKELK